MRRDTATVTMAAWLRNLGFSLFLGTGETLIQSLWAAATLIESEHQRPWPSGIVIQREYGRPMKKPKKNCGFLFAGALGAG